MNLLQKAKIKFYKDMEEQQIQKEARRWAYRLQNTEVKFNFANSTIYYGNVLTKLTSDLIFALDKLINTPLDF